jgi:hypothetical protein
MIFIADMPFLAFSMVAIRANHFVRGNLLASKIVPVKTVKSLWQS